MTSPTTPLIRRAGAATTAVPTLPLHVADGHSTTVDWLGEAPLPVLLAGPILRYTDTSRVLIWLATSLPVQVSGRVIDTGTIRLRGSSHHFGDFPVLGSGSASSVQYGRYLHITLVTLRATPSRSYPLDTFLLYDLLFAAGAGYELSDDNGLLAPEDVSYLSFGYPSFLIGRTAPIDRFSVIHASCRKLHGAGADASRSVDQHMAFNADVLADRPVAFLLTGDQIYADDVAEDLFPGLPLMADRLMGWEENVPGAPDPSRSHLEGGARARMALAAGFSVDSEVAQHHLVRFGEFAVMYLLSYSPELWSAVNQFGPTAVQGAHSLELRRVMANVPCYMMVDDHEVSDDFPMTLGQDHRVRASPFGRYLYANAMAAAWLFELKGNMASASRPYETSLQTYQQHGLTRAAVGDPVLAASREVFINQVLNERGYHAVTPTDLPIVLLDTRTQRHLYANVAPGLLNNAGFEALRAAISSRVHQGEPALIVSPAPVLGYPEAQDRLRPTGVDFAGDSEAWAYNTPSFYGLFRVLAESIPVASGQVPAVVFFSGDVHYGYLAHARFDEFSQVSTDVQGAGPFPRRLKIIQLTSSALCNQASGRAAHALSAATLTASSYLYEINVDGTRIAMKTPVDREELGAAVAYLTVQTEAVLPGAAVFGSNNFGIVRLQKDASGVWSLHQQLKGPARTGLDVRVVVRW